MDKDKAKKKYIALYRDIYADIPKEMQKKAWDIIENLAMVRTTIDECEEHIEKEGVVVTMCQGTYEIDRKNPYIDVQDKAHKTYCTLLKQMDAMLPTIGEQKVEKAGERLRAFIAAGKPKNPQEKTGEISKREEYYQRAAAKALNSRF